ncbi:MAG: FkbM family methyltransferase [Nanoarchaeota archaeon]
MFAISYPSLRYFAKRLKPSWLKGALITRSREMVDSIFFRENIQRNGDINILTLNDPCLSGIPIVFPSEAGNISWVPIELPGYFKVSLIKSGDTVYDGGAFPGDFTVAASRKVGASGKVYAFEPNAFNRAILKKTLELNKCSNVTIFPFALYNKSGTERLINEGISSKIEPDYELSRNNIASVVETITLDDFVKNYPFPAMIKLDIEGAELAVMQGAGETIRKCRPSWAIASYHIDLNGRETCEALEMRLKRNYFNVFTTYRQHLTTFAFNN